MTYEEAIKEAKVQIDVYENMILYNEDFEPKNDNSNYEHKIEFLKLVVKALEKRMRNCGNCQRADRIPNYHMVYCRIHNSVTSDDNCCRYWTPLE